jgi:hypothetical protein
MKTLNVLFLLLLPLSLISQVNVVANCSSIDLVSAAVPRPPGASPVTFVIPSAQLNVDNIGCSIIGNYTFLPIQRFRLDKEVVLPDGSRDFISFSYIQSPSAFSNLGHGTYAITTVFPTPVTKSNCVGGVVKVYGPSFNFLGNLATYQSSIGVRSKAAPVGSVQTSDVNWNFVSNSGVSLGNSTMPSYQTGTPVYINPSKTVNYTDLWLAIYENEWPYRSKGLWLPRQPTPFLFDIDIRREVWKKDDATWEFLPGNSYTVQYAISNANCGSPWANLDKTFFICPTGTACRLNTEKEISNTTISPNPVKNAFRLNNFDLEAYKEVECNLLIHDMSGRVVKQFNNFKDNNFNTEDIANGMYIVNVLKENQKIFSQKLVISK